MPGPATSWWMGQFCIANGEAQEHGPCIGSFARRTAIAGESTLYILGEPALPGSAPYGGEFVGLLGRRFQKERLSITGALVRALQLAHVGLRDWNRQSLPEHQIAFGVSCLAIRGVEAYLAQVGPSLAFGRFGRKLRRLAPATDEAALPLGVAEEIEPSITCHELANNDLLLLVSSNLASVLADRTVGDILEDRVENVLPELYSLVRGLPEFSALLVAREPAPAFQRQAVQAPPPPPWEPSAARPSPSSSALAHLRLRWRRWWRSLGRR